MSDPIPDPQIPEYLHPILDPADDAAWDTRWSTALRAALEHNGSFELIRWIVMYFEGPVENRLAGGFAWIEILEGAGWTRERLAELMLARFKAENPNCDLSKYRRCDFLRYPPAWRVAADDELVRFISVEVREHPTEVLEQNAAMVKRLGTYEANWLAVEACRFVHSLSPAAVETIMRLGREIVMNVAHQVVVYRGNNSGVPLRRVHELRLLTYAAMETRFDERSDRSSFIWMGVHEALSPDKRKSDTDQPFRVFRWMLKFAAEAPFEVVSWMRRQNPDEIKQRRHEYFVERLRKIMTDLGYGFATVAQTERNGQRQYEAVVNDRGGELKFVEANRPSSRGDTIQNGTEAIVTLRPEGKPNFAFGRGRGFVTNLHPVAVPTPAMEAEVATRHGVV